MKKLILSIVTLALGVGFAAAQGSGFSIFRVEDGELGTTNLSGTTVEFVYDGSHYYEDSFEVVTQLGTPTNLKLRRIQIIAPQTQINEQLCWGDAVTGLGTCIDYNSSNTNFFGNDPVSVTTTNAGSVAIHIYPTQTSGNLHYRYYVEEVNQNKTRHDSIDVVITNTLSVKEIKQPTMAIQVFPNPANDFIQVSLQNATTNDHSVKLIDVLGNVVLEEKMGLNKKLDVSDLKNGVYMLTIYSSGNVLQTRRMVVKH